MNFTIWSKGDDEAKELTKGIYNLHFNLPFSWPDALCITQPYETSLEVAGVKKGIMVYSLKKDSSDASHIILNIKILENPIPIFGLIAVFGILGLGIIFLTKIEKVFELPVAIVGTAIAGYMLLRK